jgi:WD40 repeat protein
MTRILAPVLGAVLILTVAGSTVSFATPIGPDNVRLLREEARVHVAFYPGSLLFLDATRLAVAGTDRTALWDVAAGPGAQLAELAELGQVLAVSSDGSLLAACTRARAVSVWRTDSLERVADVVVLRDTPYPSAAFSPDGLTLAVTNRHDEIELWDIQSGSRTATLVGHNSNLFGLTFSPDGRFLATAGGWSGSSADSDSCIKIWQPSTGALIATLPTIDLMDNHAIAFSADSARLFSAAAEALAAWDTQSWARVLTSPGGNGGLAVSPDGRLLALAYWGGSIRILESATMRVVRDLPAVDTPLSVRFSPDGARLAAGFQDGTVVVWRAP